MEKGKPTKITISALIESPIDQAWAHWTSPEHVVKWNFASDDWHCPNAENDLRPGGKYMARMEAKDGSFGFDFEAIYDKVILHKRLRYTMTDGRMADTAFEEMKNGTKMTTIFDAESQHPVEMQKEGWQAILNNFKKYSESQSR